MTNSIRCARFAFGLVLLLLSWACGWGEPTGYDPATSDRPGYDLEHPPLLLEHVFQVEGARLNAIVYVAQGPGPHPTVVLLHGFPGNEKNLDLAQAVRRAGWNVVFFHYRGSWGSEGRFSFAHVLEDVAAVVDQIALPALAGPGRIDFRRIALVGHSMGGFAALVTAAEVESVDCAVSIAGGNLGGLARALVAMPEEFDGMAETLEDWSGPLEGATGAELVAEIRANLDRFDLTTHAPVLGGKPLLLLAGRLDRVAPVAQHHTPLVEALAAIGATSVEVRIFEDADHSFSGQRVALAQSVVGWLESGCGRQD